MTLDTRQWRSAQRAQLLARRVAIPAPQRRQWNQAITRWLVEEFPILQWMVVGSYWPYQGEFDPRFAIRRLRSCGARVALPLVVQKNAPLQFREWWPGAPMVKGVLDLPVPDGTEVLLPQVLLIPPVGFDAQGYRLGYGAGYFDRTLAAMNPRPLTIGVAFEMSRVPTIQPQPHDIAMDFIVTEAGIHCIDEGGMTLVHDSWRVVRHASALLRSRGAADRDGNGAVQGLLQTALRGERRPYASPVCYAHEFETGWQDES